MDSKKLIGVTFGKQYQIQSKIGAGAFGEIFSCINLQTKQEFALKLEQQDTQFPQILFEGKLYQYLNNDLQQQSGIAKVHYFGNENGYNVLIIDKLGQSLENLFILQRKKFSIKTVCMLADQMVQRIEYLHNKNFLHRDIKPDNFLMGVGKRQHKVYIIDFGLSKRYIQQKDGSHIPYKNGKSLTGTARYASINTHLGIEQSRRDDLESIGYVIMYFLRGILPWQNQQANNKTDKYKKIMEKKMSTTTEQLCKGLPQQFAKYLNYCKHLRFDDKPDYQYLRNLFKEVLDSFKLEFDHYYDWTIPDTNQIKRSFFHKEVSQEDIKITKENFNENRQTIYPDDQQMKNSNHYQTNQYSKNKQFFGKQIATNILHNMSHDANKNFLSYDHTPEKPKMDPPNFESNFNINNQNNKNNMINQTQNSFLYNKNKSGTQNFGNLIDNHYNNLLKSSNNINYQHSYQISGNNFNNTNNNLNNTNNNNTRSIPFPKIVQNKNTINFQ